MGFQRASRSMICILLTYDLTLGMMSETEELRKERERIEQEKEELLAKHKRFVPRFGRGAVEEPSMPDLPKPVPLKSARQRLGPKIGEDPRPSTSRGDPRPRTDSKIPSRRAGDAAAQYRNIIPNPNNLIAFSITCS